MRQITNNKKNLLGKVQHFLRTTLFLKKLDNWLGYFLIVVAAIALGFLVANNVAIGLSIFAVMLGIFILILCLDNAETGLYLIAFFSFFSSFFSRLLFKEQLPVGTLFDILVAAMFVGVFTSRPYPKQEIGRFLKQPLVISLFFMLFVTTIQFFNPNSMSIDTCILAVRKFFGYIFLMFTAFVVFDSYEKARKYFTYIFVLATACGLYGCIQEYVGYFNFELQLILADPHAMGLIFVGGVFRKFSTMSDPATFGIMMAVCAAFFLIISLNEKDRVRKYVLLAGVAVMILGMGYSGTRTAYVTILAGLAFYILLNFDKKSTRIFGIASFIFVIVILFAPFYGGGTIQRFRSTFLGTKDESYKVRVNARTFIQPYIRSHPIGGGLGTTGFSGAREHPGHYLANFQPDSSYVKKAAETGWVGLAISCLLYFLILKIGLRSFFGLKEEQYKIVGAACVSALFAFYIAEFAQVAIGGIADAVVYFPILALILKVRDYERKPE